MAGALIDQVKVWAAPALLGLVLAFGGIVWGDQQHTISDQSTRVAVLERESADYKSTLATIAANQSNSSADRAANQTVVTATLDKIQTTTDARLGKIEDAIGIISSSVSVLTAIQARQEKDLGRPVSGGP